MSDGHYCCHAPYALSTSRMRRTYRVYVATSLRLGSLEGHSIAYSNGLK